MYDIYPNNVQRIVSKRGAPGEVYSIQQYVIKFVSDLWQFGGFLRVLGFPPPIQLNLPARYKWKIVESAVKYHNPL